MMRRFLFFSLLCLIQTYVVLNAQDVLPGEISINAKAIHPFWRTDPFPNNSMVVDTNPVSFYWPSERREFTEKLKEYDFQLSSTVDFSTIEAQVNRSNPSFVVVWKKLPKGKWYWRYREVGKNWNGPYSFIVGDNTRTDMRPTSDEFVSSVKGEHPRMVIPSKMIDDVKADFSKNGYIEKIKKEASKYIDVELPEYEWGGKFYKNGERVFHNKKFPDDHIKSKITSPTWSAAITSLCRAYLLTNDEIYAKEALRWGLRVCSFDIMPNVLTYDNNPYPDGFCFAFYLNCVAHVFDALYDYMNDEQRKIVLDNLAKRLEYYYKYYCNRLENRCIDNHSWQISIASFARGAIAAKGHLPEADKYLTYLYNIWMAIDPEQSRTDGGWFGGGYVGVNIDVWLEVPMYFKMFTGYNFYNTPFYMNHPYYFMYRQAPGSVEDGFSGDGYGTESKYLGEKAKLWMSVLGMETSNPVALWLSQTNKESNRGKYDMSAWTRIVCGEKIWYDKVAEKPKEIPQSRDFRDIGIVNMHTDILNPKNDLHVALRSSPYGTFGHNLASHNAFNIVYGGEYLFVPYGHRHGGAKNSAACYRHSRGHNTVLINGKGQPFSPEAYGWIPRYLAGDSIIYACGDASKAYDAEPFERETSAFKAAELSIDEHISRGEMKRFRRHVLLVGKSLVLVYDELEANAPVRWDWVLHCRKKMVTKGIDIKVEGVNAKVDFISSLPVNTTIYDKPMFMPINVDGRGGKSAGSSYPVKGNYAYVSTSEKCDRYRILSIIQVGDVNDILHQNDGSIVCGQWKIKPEIDVDKLANIYVENLSGSINFKLKDTTSGETVLIEKLNGKKVEKRVVDELPYHALGLSYNKGK